MTHPNDPYVALKVLETIVNDGPVRTLLTQESRDEASDAIAILNEFISVMLEGAPEDTPREVNVPYLRDILSAGDWQPRPGEGVDRMDSPQLEYVLGWECPSCRPAVGWSKWSAAERDNTSQVITIHIECGHCGSVTYYDAEGNQLEED